MDELTSRTIAVFDRPFVVAGYDGEFAPGEYEVTAELASPPDYRDPLAWRASVVVHIQPRVSPQGLDWSLSATLVDLDKTCARDKLTCKDLADFFLEEMLADPMVRLVMEADGVSEIQLRHLYSATSRPGYAADTGRLTHP